MMVVVAFMLECDVGEGLAKMAVRRSRVFDDVLQGNHIRD